MTLICVASAKGAPGTTTTTLLLSNLWPAPSLVVDADPLGGDIALRIPGEQAPMNPSTGLMSLLPSARRGLEPHTVLQHAQQAIGGQPVIAGLPGPEQAVAVAPLWNGLAHAFARVPGYDVFADIGQVHSRSSHLAMLEGSAAVLFVYRPTATSALHTRQRLEGLENVFRDRGIEVGIVCVANTQQSGDARTAAGSIRDGQSWVHDYGVIAHDPQTAVIYEGGEVFRPERSLLARSGSAVARTLYATLNAGVPEQPVEEPKARTRGRRPGRWRGKETLKGTSKDAPEDASGTASGVAESSRPAGEPAHASPTREPPRVAGGAS